MRIIVCLIVLLVPFTLKCQVTYNLPPKTFYNTVNVTMKDFRKYECKKVYIKSDSISFLNHNTQLNQKIALSNIEYMRVHEGNQALKWCGYGALFMGLLAVLNVAQYPDTRSSGGIIVGFTVSGAAIGGLLGLGIPKWKTYYLNY
jgi:hypothetical protein